MTDQPTSETTSETTGDTIVLDRRTHCFYAGVAAANKVNDAFDKSTPGPYDAAKIALWWFYVGSLAVSEHNVTTDKDQEPFLQGATLRAPQAPEPDDDGNADALLEVVKEIYPTAKELRFTTDEWDNGYFWIDVPLVVLEDGSTVRWGEDTDLFPHEKGDISHFTADLTHAMGPLGRHSEMTITVADGAIDDDI